MDNRIKVMLTTEGTYPFHQGGISTWCDILVKNLKNIDYVIYSIMMNPFVTQKFNLPIHASLQKMPLWNIEEPSEHLATPFSQLHLTKTHTNDDIIKKKFIPLFIDLIHEIMSIDKNPEFLAATLMNMFDYFKQYEYRKTFKSQVVWETFKKYALDFSADRKNIIASPSIYSGMQSLGWIYRFLNILNSPVPEAHVSHSSAAAFCGIPCVLAKKLYKTPMILTEHGNYLKEQYLALAANEYPSFLKSFIVRMIYSVANLSYHFADQVSPVCDYNARWGRHLGVDKNKIKVIYNGVDKNVFLPNRSISENKNPTIITVASIDPSKDILTLIRTADIVKKQYPNVKFLLYGTPTIPEYFKKCQTLKKELQLDDNFIFAGHTDNVNSVYNSGDIIAFTSISESFPLTVIEAMMVGKPIISTDVGGISEALADSGMLVTPGDHKKMAEGILKLLNNPELRLTLGEEAHDRALNLFTINKELQSYFKNYIQLATTKTSLKVIPINIKRQKLYCEKAYALLYIGQFENSIVHFRKAVKENKMSPASPVILMEIANVYKTIGNEKFAQSEMDKAHALSIAVYRTTA